jgi:hypothetical protein
MSIDADTVAAVIEALVETPQYADKFADLLTLRARVETGESARDREALTDVAACAKDDLVLDLVAELGSRKLVAA